MKRLFKLIAPAVMSAVVISGGIVSAGAATTCVTDLQSLCSGNSCVTSVYGALNGCTDIQSLCNSVNGCVDIQSLCNTANGCVDIQSLCNSGNCLVFNGGCFNSADLQTILNQNCTALPDNTQCVVTEPNANQAPVNVPTAPVVNSPTAPAAEPQKGSDTNYTVSDYEQQVVDLVNDIRAQYGLNRLSVNTELSKVARIKSEDMRDNGYFSHTSPTYGSPFDMMKSFGISYRTAGENIAMGQRTPQEVVNAWMNSEGHRANILNSSFTQIGVGYAANGNYWTQEFIG